MKRLPMLSILALSFMVHNVLFAHMTPKDDGAEYEIPMGFSGWARKQPITISASQVEGSSDLTNFPVLITLDQLNTEIVDDGSYSALNGGGDIRFSSDTSGNVQLPIDIVEFVTSTTPSNRKCQIWVKLPTLSNTSDTTIYIWYNKAGESQPASDSTYGSQAVWSDYRAIWHLEDDPSGIAPQIMDSAPYSNHGSTSVPMASNDSQPAQIGQGIILNGSNELINAGNDSSLNLTSNLTISGWFYPESYHDFYVIAKRSETVNVGYNMLLWASNEVDFYDSGNNPFGMTYVANQWNYIVMRLDATGTGAKAFINGDFSQVVQIEQLPDGLAQNLYLGGRSNGPFSLDGTLDELRVANNYRSDGWIATEYNNQLSPSSFASAGTPVDVSGETDTQSPTSPTLAIDSNSDTTVDLSWDGATDDIGVTGYRVFKDGVLESTVGNVNTYQVTGLTPSGTYAFTVTALDAAGNESAASNSISVTTDSGSGGPSGAVWTETDNVASYLGAVTVGTTSVPNGYKMAIDGKLITEEVQVQLSGNWPDYVFKGDYPLPTLEALEIYIEENGHLPNLPSAKEVEGNGFGLAEMNKLLLEKIEEMTLYLIQQNKKIDKLTKEIRQSRNQ